MDRDADKIEMSSTCFGKLGIYSGYVVLNKKKIPENTANQKSPYDLKNAFYKKISTLDRSM